MRIDLSTLFAGLANHPLFILYRLERTPEGVLLKLPTNPYNGHNSDGQDQRTWMKLSEAQGWARIHGAAFGVGLMIAPEVIVHGGRLFALDIDKAREGDRWLPHVANFMARFPGAYVECSASGGGLHIIGLYRGERPAHRTRNRDFRLEFYTGARFIALTGINAQGNPAIEHTEAVRTLIAHYFPPLPEGEADGALRTTPVAEWNGPEDDEELLRRMCRGGGPSGVFGGRARFVDLWTGNMDVLARIFPPESAGKTLNGSAADQAIANHLAWWTGNHGERIERLMRRSGLVRPKWDRPEYLRNTILRACADQRSWYTGGRGVVSSQLSVSGPPAAHQPSLRPAPPPPLERAAPPPPPDSPIEPGSAAEIDRFRKICEPGSYVDLAAQHRIFNGMVYVRDMRGVYLPSTGITVGKEQFDDWFGGRFYATSIDGQKPTNSAWDAFVKSQLYDFPKVDALKFDPAGIPASITSCEGLTYVNTWIDIKIPRTAGDIQPLLTHLKKLFPREQDALYLLWYLAALVQHPGAKAQWCPFIQGVEGNGKTLISKLMEYCVGRRHTHWPQAQQLGNHFNAAFYGKLLVCVEDVFVPEAKQALWEALKPMITATRLEITPKGVDSATRDVCFNFLLNSNHKSGIRKTRNDRRLMPLFCAQQNEEDLERDGMGLDYFRNFRRWVEGPGGPVTLHYLATCDIPKEYDFAVDCVRPPRTTSTAEAISVGFGAIEQELLEAIAQQQEGFRGGWVSSIAFDHLLHRIGKDKAISRDLRRSMLSNLGYAPHPVLIDGRAVVLHPDGSRPQLYIKRGAPIPPGMQPPDVSAAFIQAQKG